MIIGFQEIFFRIAAIGLAFLSMVSIVWNLSDSDLISYYAIIPLTTIFSMCFISPVTTKVVQVYSSKALSIYSLVLYMYYLGAISILSSFMVYMFDVLPSYSKAATISYVVCDFLFGTVSSLMLTFVSMKRGSALNSVVALCFSFLIYAVPALYCGYSKSLEGWMFASAFGRFGFFLLISLFWAQNGYGYSKLATQFKVDEKGFQNLYDLKLGFFSSIGVLFIQNMLGWLMSQGPKILAIALLDSKLALFFNIAFQSSTSVVSNLESLMRGLVENSYKNDLMRGKIFAAYSFLPIFAVPLSIILFLVNLRFANFDYIYFVIFITLVETMRASFNYRLFIYQIKAGVNFSSLVYSGIFTSCYYIFLVIFLLLNLS